MAAAILLTLLFSGTLVVLASVKFQEKLERSHFYAAVGLLFLAGLLLRLYLGATTEGFSTDLNTFKGWAQTVNRVGFQEFYSQDMFVDYPPGYVYVLWLGDKLRELLGLDVSSPAYTLLIKLPSILADLLCAAFLLWVGRERIGEKTGLFLAGAYLFCPAVFLNSAQWGQVDSFCTALVVASVFLLYRNRYVPAAALFGVAIACKPQMLVFAPVYIFFSIRQKRLKSLGLGVLVSVVAVVILATPFTKNFDYLWLLEKYRATMEYYHYYSVNAYNLWGLLRMNWISLPQGLATEILNLFGPAIAVVICGVFYFFAKRDPGEERKELIFLCPALLMASMYFFSVKMHERYLYPTLFFLLLSYVFLRDKRLLYSFSVMAAIHYLNVYYVLNQFREMGNNYSPNTGITVALSALQTAAFLYMLWAIGSIAFGGTIREARERSPQPEEPSLSQNFTTGYSLKRADIFWALAITVAYGFVAFWNLGGTTTANTSWTPEAGESVVLQAPENGDTLYFMMGISSFEGTDSYRVGANVRLEISENGSSWTDCGLLNEDNPYVYAWKQIPLETPGRYVRLTAEDGSVTINEAGLRRAGKMELMELTLLEGEGNALVDEQEVVPLYSSYLTSAYFDEIYHARTAYETILGVDAYENTHPPLGKLLISLGIRVLGMNPFGWRFVGALLGVLMLPVLYHLLKQLFGKTYLCCGGVLLFAFDFMHFTQTRIATIDTYAVFFLLLMYDAMTVFLRRDIFTTPLKKLLVPLGLCGVFTGLGIASKWTAVYGAAGLAVLYFGRMIFTFRREKEQGRRSALKRRWGWLSLWCCLFFLAIPFAIYFASFLPLTTLPKHQGNLLGSFWNYQTTMFNYHSGLVAEHYFASPWYEWPLVIRPIWYFSSDACNSQGDYSTITCMGNPLLWWSLLPGLAAAIYGLYKRKSLAGVLCVVGFAAAYLPWVLVPRLTFIYHYFNSIPFLLIGLLLLWERIGEARSLSRELVAVGPFSLTGGKLVFFAFVGLSLLLFCVFFPVISGAPTEKGYAQALRLFPTWYF